MDAQPRTPSTRITPQPMSLTEGAVATKQGWKDTLLSLGYKQAPQGGTSGPGQFDVEGTPWTIHPRGGPPMLVHVDGRRVDRLTHREDGVSIAGWDFQLPDISMLPSGRQPSGDTNQPSIAVPFAGLPTALVQAVVTRLDSRFFEHTGIDPHMVLANTWSRIRWKADDRAQATISQRLARAMLLRHEPTFLRSVQEVLLTWVLEFRYSKEELLSSYLNKAQYHGREGVTLQGIGEATAHWFQAEPPAMSPAQAVLISASLVEQNQPPQKGSALLEQRNTVVRAMLASGQLSPIEAAHTLNSPIPEGRQGPLRRNSPWFIDAVRRAQDESSALPPTNGNTLQLQTTLMPGLQRAAEQAIDHQMEQLRVEHPELLSPGTGVQWTLIAMDPKTGAIRALVGGRDYNEDSTNHAFASARPPGTAFRPLVLASIATDQRPGLTGNKGLTGRTSAPRLRATAQSMGITTPITASRSLVLGQQEVTAVELAVAMSTLANGGLRPHPHVLVGTRSAGGAWLDRQLPTADAALDPRIASRVTKSLIKSLEPSQRQTLRDSNFQLPVALHEGRSPDGRDSWALGYTPDLAVVAWLGRTGLSDSALPQDLTALSVWARFMGMAEPYLSGAALDPTSKSPAATTRDDSPPTPPETSSADQPTYTVPGSAGAKRNLIREDQNRRDEERRMLREVERSTH